MLTRRFMYGFAQVISWIRSICRVGTLYFIRDPHDPNYSAVKDMIERPTMSQLRKVSDAWSHTRTKGDLHADPADGIVNYDVRYSRMDAFRHDNLDSLLCDQHSPAQVDWLVS